MAEVAADVVAALREEQETRRCVVCMRAQREVCLLPCRHVVLCSPCAAHIERSEAMASRCPLCRVEIESTLRVFH